MDEATLRRLFDDAAARVVAGPTGAGCGASFEGIAALLGKLSSWDAGGTAVVIDKGLGAARAVARTAG